MKPTFIFRGGLILKSFAQKNPLSNSEKTFAGISCWNPGSFCNGQSLHWHGPLDRQSYICISISIYIYISISYISYTLLMVCFGAGTRKKQRTSSSDIIRIDINGSPRHPSHSAAWMELRTAVECRGHQPFGCPVRYTPDQKSHARCGKRQAFFGWWGYSMWE